MNLLVGSFVSCDFFFNPDFFWEEMIQMDYGHIFLDGLKQLPSLLFWVWV